MIYGPGTVLGLIVGFYGAYFMLAGQHAPKRMEEATDGGCVGCKSHPAVAPRAVQLRSGSSQSAVAIVATEVNDEMMFIRLQGVD